MKALTALLIALSASASIAGSYTVTTTAAQDSEIAWTTPAGATAQATVQAQVQDCLNAGVERWNRAQAEALWASYQNANRGQQTAVQKMLGVTLP